MNRRIMIHEMCLVLCFSLICVLVVAADSVLFADETGPHQGRAAVMQTPVEQAPPDINGLKIDGLTWKKRYYEAMMENVKLFYQVKMLTDPRWIALRRGLDDTKTEIDRLTTDNDKTAPAQPETQSKKHTKEDVNR